jgi:hypothetical protein
MAMFLLPYWEPVSESSSDSTAPWQIKAFEHVQNIRTREWTNITVELACSFNSI